MDLPQTAVALPPIAAQMHRNATWKHVAVGIYVLLAILP
jgi:hypothetical protein